MWPLRRANASGFSGSSTAEEVTKGIDGTGLTAVVTGASSGIGLETARVLALRGVHVIMGVRNLSTGAKIKESIIQEIPTAKIDALGLDLSSFASVRKFASDFDALNLHLNILINNAGIMYPFSLSVEGLEMQFATNHVGHFLLTNLLLENMKRTSRRTNIEGRIVNVSSMGHKFSYRERIRFEKINDPSEFSQLPAYGQSKLANILHANELALRFREKGTKITANSLHPGVISTNLTRHHSFVHLLNRTIGKLLFKNVHQGAATTCYVALHPQVEGVSGKYFVDSTLSSPSAKSADPNLAKKLWNFSMELVV